jgi:hypothetical protein
MSPVELFFGESIVSLQRFDMPLETELDVYSSSLIDEQSKSRTVPFAKVSSKCRFIRAGFDNPSLLMVLLLIVQ